MDTLNMSQYVVRNEDGSLNSNETVAKFAKDLTSWETSQKADLEQVYTQILNTFAHFGTSTRINLPALHGEVARSLGVCPVTMKEEHKLLGERVRAVVHSYPQTFEVGKGRNGGVTLKTQATTAAA